MSSLLSGNAVVQRFLLPAVLLLCPLLSQEKVERVLKDYLPNLDIKNITLHPLQGGLSAQVFLVETENDRFVIRFLDDRKTASEVLKELWLTTLTSEKQISPAILHMNLSERAIIMEYVLGEETTDTLRLAQTLNKLHLRQSFEPFASLHRLRAELSADTCIPPKETQSVCEELDAIEASISTRTWSLCHNDLHRANVLSTAQRECFIDWESGDVGIPEFDIVKLTALWSDEKKEEFYSHYYGRSPTDGERALLRQMQQAYLALIFFNRWRHLQRRVDSDEMRQEIRKKIENWQILPLKKYQEYRLDGSLDDLFEGSLSALKDFLETMS